ncbi:MAG: hypothetical protein LBS23_02350 [Holosporaceae bacterium]|jgi:hypothetical protein|nr:hypothetical protein [Holosporaceae bacterium]
MEIHERIKQIRTILCNDSNEDFAKIVGEKTNTTSNWIGNRKIGLKVIIKILKHFPMVNPSWLVIEEGDMLKATTTTNNSDISTEIQKLKDELLEVHRENRELNKENNTLKKTHHATKKSPVARKKTGG